MQKSLEIKIKLMHSIGNIVAKEKLLINSVSSFCHNDLKKTKPIVEAPACGKRVKNQNFLLQLQL